MTSAVSVCFWRVVYIYMQLYPGMDSLSLVCNRVSRVTDSPHVQDIVD